MLSRTIRTSLLDTRISSAILPPVFLLPNRARYFNNTTQHVESPPDSFGSSQLPTAASSSAVGTPLPPATSGHFPPRAPSPPSEPLTISESIRELLPALAAQPSHYITIHIHGKPYLVTIGDSVRLPFHMPGVVPGDVLRLNRAINLGSRDFTLKGSPYVDDRIFECRAVVMGTEAEPMRTKEKTKRRNRKIKTVKSKHKYTILKISELKVKGLEEVEN